MTHPSTVAPKLDYQPLKHPTIELGFVYSNGSGDPKKLIAFFLFYVHWSGFG